MFDIFYREEYIVLHVYTNMSISPRTLFVEDASLHNLDREIFYFYTFCMNI